MHFSNPTTRVSYVGNIILCDGLVVKIIESSRRIIPFEVEHLRPLTRIYIGSLPTTVSLCFSFFSLCTLAEISALLPANLSQIIV